MTLVLLGPKRLDDTRYNLEWRTNTRLYNRCIRCATTCTGPVDPAFRALSGRLNFTFFFTFFFKDSLSSWCSSWTGRVSGLGVSLPPGPYTLNPKPYAPTPKPSELLPDARRNPQTPTLNPPAGPSQMKPACGRTVVLLPNLQTQTPHPPQTPTPSAGCSQRK